MCLPVKVNEAIFTKRRSNAKLVFVKTDSKAVWTIGHHNMGIVRLVAYKSGPGNVELVITKQINGRTSTLQ